MQGKADIVIYGSTLSAEDYRRVCDLWRQARRPIIVRFEMNSEALFARDDTIVNSTATVLPLREEAQPA